MEKREGSDLQRVEVSGITIGWQPGAGVCTFENLPVIMLWLDSTLAGLMAGVRNMVGTERFALALQSEGRNSVEADWQVISRYPSFAEGFEAIANIAAVAGWGRWQLILLDPDNKECRFRVHAGWEGLYQRALNVCWGSGMVAGKLAGYCSRLFDTNCWADQVSFTANGDPWDEFVVRPSERLIETEIENLLATDEATRADMAVALHKLGNEIKERRQIEEALRASESKFRTFLTAMTDLVFVFDERGRFTYYHSPSDEILLLPPEKFLGRHVSETLPPHVHEKFSVCFEQIRNGNDAEFDYMLHMPGSDRWFSAKLSPIFSDAEFKGAVGVVRDITERKQAEEDRLKLELQMQQAQKLEALGVLAAGIAHDFNNLLGGIYGYLDMARAATREPQIVEYLGITVRTMNRARSLTQQLLTFAKGGAPMRKPGHLQALIRETAQFALSGSNVSCAFDIAEDLWPCDFDANQIGQVLDNIIINAVQAMPLGGVVHVRAANSRTGDGEASLPAGRYVRISIRDTGVGMPADLQSRIFEPFFTTKQKGSGLGLATAYSIIKRHGGAIEVESAPGKGSTFHLVLPASEQSVAPPAPAAARASLSGYKFLILEDEEVLRKILCTMLNHEGCTVVCADDARQAVEAFTEALNAGSPFQAAILDLTIPGGSGGKDAIVEIRKLDPGVPVFVSSGYADSPVMSNPKEHGFTDSISKPFTRSELLEMLARNLKG